MDKFSSLEKRLRICGIFGIISLLSYSSMVLFFPFAFPDYDWKSMAVSELTAYGSPSQVLANQLNSLFGPCAILNIMAIYIEIVNCSSELLILGIYSFMLMEWITQVGYTMFPLKRDSSMTNPQNIMHIITTILVVIFSLISLVLIAIGSREVRQIKSIGKWARASLVAMITGSIGTALLPKSVFGIFERFSAFSVVVFNAILGIYLMNGKFLFNIAEKKKKIY